MKIRYPAVEGSFYPSNEKELEEMMSRFDKIVQVEEGVKPKAIIVPHAGLFYSGLTAAYAYKNAHGHKYRSAVIFAPSHRVAFYGMSGADFDEFQFIGRNFKVNRELTETLKKKNNLVSIDQAHLLEHSAEIQLPFIKKYLDVESISVFVYGEIEYDKISYVLEDVVSEGKDLVIISSDLSHYHPYEACKRIDQNIIDGIKELDIAKIDKGEACGMAGIKAMVNCAITYKLKPLILDYRNSGDIIKDRSGVVGYLSAIFV
ncbi:MAG: AmmeMemoRadiSam system protein B [Candidatus Delongbacteria bacterium]|nr:AmmeMemoRadiSam system protein B [Candidatus Delongbacteria bacterium]MCG2761265.1 AmmeMemoRadiSam system protein B [Candidatus Delongbacteria bacterium]